MVLRGETCHAARDPTNTLVDAVVGNWAIRTGGTGQACGQDPKPKRPMLKDSVEICLAIAAGPLAVRWHGIRLIASSYAAPDKGLGQSACATASNDTAPLEDSVARHLNGRPPKRCTQRLAGGET